MTDVFATRWLSNGKREDWPDRVGDDERFAIPQWTALGSTTDPNVWVIASYIGSKPHDEISPKTEAFL
jgi:hypothetical protein